MTILHRFMFFEVTGKYLRIRMNASNITFSKEDTILRRLFLLLTFFPHVLSAANAQSAPIFQPGAPGSAPTELSADDSVALSTSVHTPEDTRFMQDMILHHGQAVEMVALIDERTRYAPVVLTGERITSAQSFEIEMMRGWLRARNESLDSPLLAPHDHGMGHKKKHDMHMEEMAHDPDDHPLMHGMLSANQMKALAASNGRQFDLLFLKGMIQHHQGALDMVDMLMADERNGQDPELSEFLSAVVADQSAEILRMQHLIKTYPATAKDER